MLYNVISVYLIASNFSIVSYHACYHDRTTRAILRLISPLYALRQGDMAHITLLFVHKV